MSTKLFHGFQLTLPGGNTLSALHACLMEARAALVPLAEDKLTRQLLRRAVLLHDQHVLGITSLHPQSSALLEALTKLFDRLRDYHHHQRRDPAIDMSFEVTLHPLPDGRLLGLYFTEQHAFIDYWLSIPGISAYPYWDNADRPNNLSMEEWDARRRDWGLALAPHDTPSLCGFTATIVNDSVGPQLSSARDRFQIHCPTYEERCSIGGLLFTFHALNLTTAEAQAKFLRASGNSDAQQQLVREHAARIRRVLPDTITFEQLTVEGSQVPILGPP